MTPRHAAQPGSHKKRWLLLSTALAVCVATGSVVAVVATRPSTTTSSAPTKSSGPFSVVATSPTDSTTVDSTAAIRVSLSQSLASTSPLPTLTPAIPGTWQRLSDSVLEFVQQAPFQPGQAITVTVPGGAGGLTATSGAHLVSSVTTSFQVSTLSLTRVQQLLAEEGYLPVTFTPSVLTSGAGVATGEETGTFTWRWSTLPSSLTSQWRSGENTVVTQGAIMRFEDVHHLATDGSITPQFEAALVADRAAGVTDPAPYTFVDVFKGLPQKLNLYSNGQIVYTTLVNTGIPGQDTPSGMWPVYLRYRTTTMSGLNPDGTPYHDEGIPWTSYFHGGDALHGFIRSTYGWPQSLGCVEMTYDHAGVVWPQTPIGTLVSVA